MTQFYLCLFTDPVANTEKKKFFECLFPGEYIMHLKPYLYRFDHFNELEFVPDP